MIGIDHNLAEVKERELFSFTKKTAVEAMETLKQKPGISGLVLIFTCNRVELYVHGDALCKASKPILTSFLSVSYHRICKYLPS